MLFSVIATGVLKFLSAVLLTELLTELVIKSEITKPARDFIKSRGSWLETLFSCGYCFSVWTAFGVAFLLGLAYNLTGWYWVDLTLTSLLIHRLSNYLHNFNDKILDKYYDTRFSNSGSMPEEEE